MDNERESNPLVNPDKDPVKIVFSLSRRDGTVYCNRLILGSTQKTDG